MMPRFLSKDGDNWINIGLSEMTDDEFEDWMESDAHRKEILEHEIYRRLEQKYAPHITANMIKNSLADVIRHVYHDLQDVVSYKVINTTVTEFYKLMTPEVISENLNNSFRVGVLKMAHDIVAEATPVLEKRFDEMESRLNRLSENQDALMAYLRDLALKVESKG